MKVYFLLLLMFSFSSFALEVDEKLTVRILKTTDSRKTVMINRGTEDGLVEGDHARFLVTAGIVARGVLVSVSPTRSIWSIYRLVNADFIVNDAVMTIKITPPVKITKDETQVLVAEDVPTVPPTDPAALGIPLADGAQDLADTGANVVDENDLRNLEDITIVERNVEIFGLLSISGLTATTTGPEDVGSAKGSMANHHIGLGAELYSQKERDWYSRFSLMGGVNIMRLNSQAYNGVNANNDVTEFQLGVNWHPGTMPSATYRFIPYFHVSGSIGNVKSEYVDGISGESLSTNGSTNGFSIGFGYKYYTQKGFGGRVLLDYYQRGEELEEDTLVQAYSRTVNGPRLLLGLSYRF